MSEEALINDQQLFRARQEYERQEAAAKAAEAAERCAPQRRIACAAVAYMQRASCVSYDLTPALERWSSDIGNQNESMLRASCRLAKAREEATAKEAQRVERERQRAAEAAELKRRADEAAAARRAAFEEGEAASAALLAEKTAAAQAAREERERQLAAEREQARRSACGLEESLEWAVSWASPIAKSDG